MKIGILGGSFNPAHLGHIHLSNLALENCALDEIWLVPTVQNPFKDKESYAPFDERFASCLEIAKNYPKIVVKNFAKDSFSTYELVKKIQAENKQDRFCFVMGADNLEKFHLWKNFSQLINLIEFAIFSRGEYLLGAKQTKAWQLYEEILAKKNKQNFFSQFFGWLKAFMPKNICARSCATLNSVSNNQYNLPKFSLFQTKNYDISSSAIRNKL